MRRVIARCVLLEIALREAIAYGLGYRQQDTDAALHEARELRREIRRARAS